MKLRLIPVLLLLLIAGCATSEGFKIGAAAAGPVLSKRITGYGGDAAALATATAVKDKVDFQTVVDAWEPLREPYAMYLETDTTISDRDKFIRLRTATVFDALIEAERKRRAGWGK